MGQNNMKNGILSNGMPFPWVSWNYLPITKIPHHKKRNSKHGQINYSWCWEINKACMLICNKKRNKLSIFVLVVSVNDSRRHTKKVSKIFPPFDSFAISRLPNRNKPVMWSGAVASVVDWNREINESSLTLGTDDPLGWTLLTVFYGKDLPQYLEPIHGKLWMRMKSC